MQPPIRKVPPGGIERVVLLGYMCSGKSTVGRVLAGLLGWDFLDFDVEIERRLGRGIGEIVDEEGEGYLRDLEASLTAEAAGVSGLVLAPGGGWITEPSFLEVLGPETASVWLMTSPEEVVRRLRSDPMDRPLKDHPDAVAVVAQMQAEREALYSRADIAISTDGLTPEEVAREIAEAIRAPVVR